MVSQEKAFEIIKQSLESLKRSDVIKTLPELTDETVLLGENAMLDSLGFVTFVTEIEDRLYDETDKDLYLALDELQTYCGDIPILTTKLLSEFMTTLKED